ncbi:MAG: M3 family oligoendopeptidase [Bacteroidia bacterium]|nr:M3 family oligoendopeptidase [Bacteroidia bacterium]
METNQIAIPSKPIRKFLPQDLTIDSWSKVESYFVDLKNRTINSVQELEKWLFDRSELEAVLSEDLAWRYIKMTCDTANEELTNSYNFFVEEIEPKVAPLGNELNKKFIACPFIDQLDQSRYAIYIRGVRKALELYRDENIPLQTKIATESQKYGAITAAMTIEWKGKEITLQMAGSLLKDVDRAVREEVYHKIQERRSKDVDKLNELYSELIQLRHQVALNAGFKNYRDYKFEELGRFDYTVNDCYNFHQSISKEILPLAEASDLERKKTLKLDVLKPWDGDVDLEGKPPLKPFENGAELTDKSIECFYKIRRSYGEYLEIMKAMGHLDLDSRKGKAPGGYNYPLYEIGVPFIFMNSVGLHRDLVTMVHEGGHAIHSFVTRDMEITDFKSTPSEVAELASMSMELISMEHWNVFFKKFSTGVYDYTGLEAVRERGWQSQLHIFEVPFYYIEYGMAQLGAIAVWRNYKKDPEDALNKYEAALRLGYTKSIPEIYKTAGVKFDFSQAYVKELADFVKLELEKI